MHGHDNREEDARRGEIGASVRIDMWETRDGVSGLTEGDDPTFAEEGEESDVYFRGRQGIAQGRVATLHAHPEAVRDAFQAEICQRSVDQSGKQVGIEHRVTVCKRREAEPNAFPIQEAEIEPGVVAHEHAPPAEAEERRQDRLDGRSVGHHGIRDAVERDACGRDRPARIHQRVKDVVSPHDTTPNLDTSERDDAVSGVSIEACGLTVEHGGV
jgi:hypothetical protein